MTKKPIVLPKDYFSWSQLNLWEKSKNEYIKRYFEGKKGFTTKEMFYGSKIGKALETQNFFDLSQNEQSAVVQIDRADAYEKKIILSKEVTGLGVDLLMYIDAVFDSGGIDEYKTGKKAWDQKRVDEHGQLDFYAYGYYLETKTIPEVNLHWIETENVKDKIQATGRVEKFTRVITMDDIKAIEKRIAYVVEEISTAYTNWKFSSTLR